MIEVYNSAYGTQQKRRVLSMDEVTIHTQEICQFTSRPYILFEHKDFPLGALRAEFNGEIWCCDLDQERTMATYNKESVDAEIRKDPRISSKEAKLIHALLKGHKKNKKSG